MVRAIHPSVVTWLIEGLGREAQERRKTGDASVFWEWGAPAYNVLANLTWPRFF